MRYERSLAVAGRLQKLIELVRAGAYSTPGLAKTLCVSEQTIYRDVLFLKRKGYDIRAAKHAKGWAYHLLAEPDSLAQAKGSPGT